jgi:NAD(P)-dependent dehydrogenase (short-subunit alcohol dehydrogenase family)
MNSTGRLTGKVAIITGAAQGISAEYARASSAACAAAMDADVSDASSVAAAINDKDGKAAWFKTG